MPRTAISSTTQSKRQPQFSSRLAPLLAGACLCTATADADVVPTGATTPLPGDAYWASAGNSTTTVYIGILAPGTLNIDDGSVFTSQSVWVGRAGNGVGEATLSGAGTQWNTNGMRVGWNAPGASGT